jgi:hypothetical protein
VQIYSFSRTSQAPEVATVEIVDVSSIPWGNTIVDCNDVCRLRHLQWYVVLSPALPKILAQVQAHLKNGVQKLGFCCRTGTHCSRALAELVVDELRAEDRQCLDVHHLEADWICQLCPASSDPRLSIAFQQLWSEAGSE